MPQGLGLDSAGAQVYLCLWPGTVESTTCPFAGEGGPDATADHRAQLGSTVDL